MATLAVVAIVLRRNVSRDHFALGWCQSVRALQEDLHQIAHRLGGLGTKRQWTADAGQSFCKFNMCHFMSSGFNLSYSDSLLEKCSWARRKNRLIATAAKATQAR